MMTLALPWRTPPLSLNDRLHWAAKARLSRTVRASVCLLAKTGSLPSYNVSVVVTLHYRQKVRRPIDADNLYATVKPCLDGLRDAGVLRDDTTAHVTPLIEVHEAIPGEPGALWLTIANAEVEVGGKP